MFRATVIAAELAAAPARAFIAVNDMVAELPGPASFVMPFRGHSGSSGSRCAAGDYAEPSPGSPAALRAGLRSVAAGDLSLTVGHARVILPDRIPESS